VSHSLWTRDAYTDETDRYMNAEKYGLERIYFGGYFIRGVEIENLYMLELKLMCRTRGNDRDPFICHPILEQRHKTCTVSPT
jgi:hypothetical protein